MADKSFDVIVIGGGPGGYVCAIRAAQLGFRVACVEKRAALGGTCLNVGCIPSKALLQSSHLFDEARTRFAEHGIEIQPPKLNLKTMMARKAAVIEANTRGIDYLFKKNGIERFTGHARLTGNGGVRVCADNNAPIDLSAAHIVVATGSVPAPLNGVGVDETRILSSTGALAMEKVPETLAVIGAGVIGLELGSVWSRLGAKVTVIEYLDHILPPLDGEVRAAMQKLLAAQGFDFHLSRSVTAVEPTKKGVSLTIVPAKGDGETTTLEAEAVLVAVGRRPATADMGLEDIGVTLTDRGFIAVDDHYRTSVSGVYAIGDVIGGMMLAHKAEEEGVALAECLAGQAGHVDYDLIPSVVYTAPEAAGVGKTEEMLKAAAIPYTAGKFPFSANGRAKANGHSDGFVKLLAHAETDRLLGCHIVGPQAGDLIMEAVTAMVYGATSEDIAYTCHPHPQLAEAIKEAALAVHRRPLHL